jgi:pyruvate dehydrogenase E2 component (dihydrolipoamide acetyltransferase)
MATVEVTIPDIGDFDEVAVIELLVQVGDKVRAEQSLITVESDKASMEIPCSHAGVVMEMRVKLGDKVKRGSVIVLVEAASASGLAVTAPPVVAVPPVIASEAKKSSPEATQPVTASPSGLAVTPPVIASEAKQSPGLPRADGPRNDAGLPHASPSVRKFARELGVPLNEVKGSGPKGRISQEDVQAFSRAVMTGETRTQAQSSKSPSAEGGAGLGLIPWPKVDFAKFGPIERKELGRIQKISGANLLRNAVMIPAVTNHDDADITELEAFRVLTNKEHEKSGIKVTMLAFLIKACVSALQKFPQFNSSLDGDTLVYKHYWHIGFAADTPNGLMVPVLKDADKKGILQISTEMGELAKKAREGKLSPAEMSGATFTISSLGGIGGRYFTPIINAPEVAILGVCRSTMEPAWNGQEFEPRLMLPLSLTWDHRVIDGAAAARFNAYLGQVLGDFRRVLL